MRFIKLSSPLVVKILLAIVGVGLFLAGYLVSHFMSNNRPNSQSASQKKDYYVSFDDYYYEIPKQKTVNDRLVPGGQFLYNVGVAIKTNTLEDVFNAGAIGIQALIPLNSDKQAFERYVNESVKPSAASAFGGTAEVSFSDRKGDKIRVAEVVSKKDGAVIRRQFIINLPQSVNVITKDDGEAYRKIGESIGQASAKFADYDQIKLQILAQSFMLSNRMFDDMYRLAHDDLRLATSVDELNRLADRSKDIFSLQAKVSGVEINGPDMTATVYYTDTAKPANSKTATLVFKQTEGVWKLYGIKLPNGSVSGAVAE